MDKKVVARDYAFPGCCGVTHLHRIDPKTTKTAFFKYLKETNESFGLGGLVTVISQAKDRVLRAKLKEYGFTVLYRTDSEWLWVRRIKFR